MIDYKSLMGEYRRPHGPMPRGPDRTPHGCPFRSRPRSPPSGAPGHDLSRQRAGRTGSGHGESGAGRSGESASRGASVRASRGARVRASRGARDPDARDSLGLAARLDDSRCRAAAAADCPVVPFARPVVAGSRTRRPAGRDPARLVPQRVLLHPEPGRRLPPLRAGPRARRLDSTSSVPARRTCRRAATSTTASSSGAPASSSAGEFLPDVAVAGRRRVLVVDLDRQRGRDADHARRALPARRPGRCRAPTRRTPSRTRR